MARSPRGYLGKNHQTLGSDIIAVVDALTLPEQTLGREAAQRIKALDPKAWYPVGMFLELLETMHREIGRYGMIKIGRTVFKRSHEARLKQVAKSARDVIYGVNAMYQHANRGEQIGEWKVLSFAAGRAEVEKTTPHMCVMEEGILGAALAAVGVGAIVEQEACFREGQDACRFVITSMVTGPKWG